MASDERLARVTYLPGAKPAQQRTREAGVGAASRAPATSEAAAVPAVSTGAELNNAPQTDGEGWAIVSDSGVPNSGASDSGASDSGASDSGVSDSGISDPAVSDAALDPVAAVRRQLDAVEAARAERRRAARRHPAGKALEPAAGQQPDSSSAGVHAAHEAESRPDSSASGVRSRPPLAPVRFLRAAGQYFDDDDLSEDEDLDGPSECDLIEAKIAKDAGAAVARREKAEIAREKKAARAANVSLAALARRGMSRWELEQTLVSREIDADEIELELDRLASVGLIDDAALAETLVRTRHERKGLGRSALSAELRRRHIDQEVIDVALEQIDGDDERTRARELAERRAPQLRSLDQQTAERRLNAFLMRKGYASDIVRDAVAHALPKGGGGVRFR